MTQISGKQVLAIQELLTGKTIPETSAACGVSVRQVYRWLESADFANKLIDEQDVVIQRAGVRLAGMVDQALTALADVLDNPDLRGANVKRLAARDVLEMLLKWREQIDFAARLDALEDRIDETHR